MLPGAARHSFWHYGIEPVAEVKPGVDVVIDVPDALGNLGHSDVTVGDIDRLSRADLIPSRGPIRIKDARPGQTLIATIRNVEVAATGWTAIVPGVGLLSDLFRTPKLVVSTIADGQIDFMGQRLLPLRPSAGVIGMAPAGRSRTSTFAVRRTGGRLGLSQLVSGSSLYLPVEIEGGLFSIGEGLAALGVGLVCGTGVETSLKLTVRFALTTRRIGAPELVFHPSAWPLPPDKAYHAVVGVAPDLREATRTAVLRMIDLLTFDHGLTAEAAYMLIGIQSELRIAAVNEAGGRAVSLRVLLPEPRRVAATVEQPNRHSLDGTTGSEFRHDVWDNSLLPVLEIHSGDELAVTVPDVSAGRVKRDTTLEQLQKIDWKKQLPLVGPIKVEGAQPGQTLRVELRSADTAEWGWTAILPGRGLLADQFPDTVLRVSAISGGFVNFLGKRKIPTRPFAGVMGVAPALPGRHS
ncbi:MAG: acetamidase/formamidase family protein, partial [Rhodospirillaceae bacterium]